MRVRFRGCQALEQWIFLLYSDRLGIQLICQGRSISAISL